MAVQSPGVVKKRPFQDRDLVPVNLHAVLPQEGGLSVRPKEIRLGPGQIEWRTEAPGSCERGAPASECLNNFLNLADAQDPHDFLRFAERHGVLGLAEDGIPAASRGLDGPRVSGDPEWRRERIADWRAYAKNALMMLMLARALKGDRRIDPREVLGITESDWPTLPERLPVDDQGLTHARTMLDLTGTDWLQQLLDAEFLGRQRKVMAKWFQRVWLRGSMISPEIEWGDRSPRLSLTFAGSGDSQGTWWHENGLFNVLTAVLFSFVCSDRSIALCDHCRDFYVPKKAQTHQTNYCPSCRPEVRKATNRKSMRRQYQNKKWTRYDRRKAE